ncbi:MAG: c-type cytochrome [Desulfuromonadales bacterium]|nr:c-type cytochrome [Desulfuromonadales bacterium]
MRLPALTSLLFILIPSIAGAAQPDAEALARRLLNSQGCKACHLIEEAGASTGPNLEKVGGRLTREQLRLKLANPQKRHANGRIADFSHLPGNEIDALTLFLSNRK